MAVLLENALAEELPSQPPPLSPRLDDRIPSSPPPTKTERDKMIAASVGALLTSLTMTPFDVIKTRLQTAPPSAPPPAAAPPHPTSSLTPHLPPTHPLSTHTPYPPPVPSTSAAGAGQGAAFFAPNASAAAAATGKHASSGAAGHADRSLLPRFDPRLSRSSLPASGAHASFHLSTSSSSSSSISLSLPPSLPTASSAAAPARPPPPLPPTRFLPLVSHIIRHESPTALWRGTAPALAMSVPGQVVYMLGYDWGRRSLLALGQKGGVAGAQGGWYETAVPLVSGAASRTVVAVLLSPVELVRTQLQAHTSTSPSSSSRDLLGLIRALRWSSAWNGLGPTLWRDVPFSGVYWAGYEVIKRGLNKPRAVRGGKVGSVGEGLGEFGTAFVSGAGSGM
ncbi:hypothetical protein JCM10207_000642, partial [Rhodosporidiobolus poonsookiae]